MLVRVLRQTLFEVDFFYTGNVAGDTLGNLKYRVRFGECLKVERVGSLPNAVTVTV